MDVGVPGVDGEGDGTATSCVVLREVDRFDDSPGAGLPDIRRAGSSILVDRLYCDRVKFPSRDFNAQMCTDRSLL